MSVAPDMRYLHGLLVPTEVALCRREARRSYLARAWRALAVRSAGVDLGSPGVVRIRWGEKGSLDAGLRAAVVSWDPPIGAPSRRRRGLPPAGRRSVEREAPGRRPIGRPPWAGGACGPQSGPP